MSVVVVGATERALRLRRDLTTVSSEHTDEMKTALAVWNLEREVPALTDDQLAGLQRELPARLWDALLILRRTWA